MQTTQTRAAIADRGAAYRAKRLASAMHAVRTVAFAFCLLVVGLHLVDRGMGPDLWVGLLVQFLIYPQLLRVRTRAHSDPLRAEWQHLYLDAALLGAWVAAIDFSLWITFPFLLGPALNATVNRGAPGLLRALAASAAGVVLGVLVFGFDFVPESSPVVTALCFAGSIAYVIAVGSVVHRQTQRLARAQQSLAIAAHTFAHMNEAMIITSADGTVLSVNGAYTRITGWDAGEALGRNERELRSSLQPDTFYDDLDRSIETKGRWSGALWSRRRDGRLYREWRSVSCVRDETGRITHRVTIFFDMEDRDAALEAAATRAG